MSKNPFTIKSIIKMSWPVFIEFALSALVGIVDIAMVSNVGDAAVSAVGLVDSINMLFISVFMAIATGTTVVVAQLYGKGDREKIGKTIGQSTLLIVLLMSAVGGAILLFGGRVFDLLYPGVESAVKKNGYLYFKITALSYPATALFSNLSGAFRGRGNTRTTMRASVIVNAVNIGLDSLFIFGLGWGVAGDAIATVIGRYAGCAVMVAAAIKTDGRHVFSFENMRIKLGEKILGPLLRISLPAGFDALLFQSGKIIVSTFIGGLPTSEISANTIALSTFGLLCIPGNAFAVAATTTAGQCYGAGLRRYAKQNLLRCVVLSALMLSGISILLFWPAKYILAPYNPSPEALPIAISLFRLLLIMIPLWWPTAFVTSNGLRAVGDIGYVTVISVVSMWTMRVFGAWLLGKYFGLGALGINLAMGLDWVLRSAFYVPRILTMKRLKSDAPPEPESPLREALLSAGESAGEI